MLDFCSYCGIIGHNVTNCRWLQAKKKDVTKIDHDKKNKESKHCKPTTPVRVATKNHDDIGTFMKPAKIIDFKKPTYTSSTNIDTLTIVEARHVLHKKGMYIF